MLLNHLVEKQSLSQEEISQLRRILDQVDEKWDMHVRVTMTAENEGCMKNMVLPIKTDAREAKKSTL